MTQRWLFRLATASALLALVVIAFGAFVRLSDAGLSCPDWPTCYGQAAWPTASADIAVANAAFPQRPVAEHLAWREQLHRHLAALLGFGVLALALLSVAGRPTLRRILGGAVVVVLAAIASYRSGAAAAALGLAGLALAILFAAAAALRRDAARPLAPLAVSLLGVIIIQALFGMWTVTWLLKPIIVVGHLAGGMLTFALLSLLAWRARPSANAGSSAQISLPPGLRMMAMVGLMLVAIQILLGGWTSANYAAIACGTDWPTCLGQWAPATDFGEAFVPWRGIGVDYEGGVLDHDARVAIQLVHRWFAWLVAGHLIALALLLKRRGFAVSGHLLLALISTQLMLGIGNVVMGLSIAVAVAHTAVAAMLAATLTVVIAGQPRMDARTGALRNERSLAT